jgi:carbon-monoxide dehydrogenase large subunit
VGNVDLPDALCVGFVVSQQAHALIEGIDTTDARAVSGVVDIVTAADLNLAPVTSGLPGSPAGTHRRALADDRVRYVGEPIVAVVAETEAAAADGVAAVIVDYDPLDAVTDPERAREDEVILFPDVGTNVMLNNSGGVGAPDDVDACEVVVEARMVNQRVAPCPIEGRVGAAFWDSDGRLVQYASCQGAHPYRAALAEWHGLDESRIRVITKDVGGSFGSKARPYPEELLLAILSERSGRPVRWVPGRSDDMVGLGHSRAQRQTIRLGGDRDGTLRALDAHILVECGAYPVSGAMLGQITANLLPGPYAIDSVRWEVTAVVTNATPCVAYRGAGRPEAAALLDRAVDLFAAEIDADPVEVRRRSLRSESQLPWTSPSGLTYDSGDYHDALRVALEKSGYEDLRAEQQRRRQDGDSSLLGLGLCSFIDRTAAFPGSEYGSVLLNEDGSVQVLTGSSPYGQGHYTTWAMLVSEQTGIPIERIEVIHGDTDLVPRGGLTGGSRSAQLAGSAVSEATSALVEEASQRAAELLEAAPADVVLDTAAGHFHVAGSPGARAVTWADIAVSVARDDGPGLQCEADFESQGGSVPYGTYVAVVEVDPETGHVSLERLVTVDDAGTILNPMLALGQVHGGAGQAVGQALFEEFAYDESGNPLTASLLDYTMPSAAEMPSFESYLTEHPSPNNPLGAKGIGESGTIGGVPAIQNAVIDAVAHLGIDHIDLPLTPERVWQEITAAQKS